MGQTDYDGCLFLWKLKIVPHGWSQWNDRFDRQYDFDQSHLKKAFFSQKDTKTFWHLNVLCVLFPCNSLSFKNNHLIPFYHSIPFCPALFLFLPLLVKVGLKKKSMMNTRKVKITLQWTSSKQDLRWKYETANMYSFWVLAWTRFGWWRSSRFSR